MLVLGVGGLLHDASAALLSDGRVLCAVESEKVTRHHREVSALPVEAIDTVLRQAGARMADVRSHRHELGCSPSHERALCASDPAALATWREPWRSVGAQIAIAGSHRTASMELSARMGKLPPVHPVIIICARRVLVHAGLVRRRGGRNHRRDRRN